jgi:hypothetical protein
MNVESPRVDPKLQQHSLIHLTPHLEADNAPYVHQGMVWGDLFDTFKEEHMVNELHLC